MHCNIKRIPPPQHQIRQVTEYLQLAGVKSSDLKSRLPSSGMKRPSNNISEDSNKRMKTETGSIQQNSQSYFNKQQIQNHILFIFF